MKARPSANKKVNQAHVWLQQALQRHQAGQLTQAKDCYQRSLQLAPHNADARHYFGVLQLQTGSIAEGVANIEAALAQQDSPAVRGHLACGLMQQDRYAEALAHFDHVLAHTPHDAAAHTNRGQALGKLGRWPEAIAAHREALRYQTHFPEAYCSLASALRHHGEPHAAIDLLTEALAQQPMWPEAHNQLGLAYSVSGQPETALAHYAQAVSQNPHYLDAHSNRFYLLRAQERWMEALSVGHTLFTLQPNNLDLQNNIAHLLLMVHQNEVALQFIDDALTTAPQHPALLHNRAIALTQLQHTHEALALFNTLIAETPSNAALFNDRATAYQALQQFDAAEADLLHALTLAPDTPSYLTNLGMNAMQQKQHATALQHFEHALALNPQQHIASFNASLVLLAEGDWAQGFARYEVRWRLPFNQHPALTCPRWRGQQTLQGKHLLLWCEQGLGDSLMCLRFIPSLLQRGARISLFIQAPLRKLVQQLKLPIDYLTALAPDFSADFHCPLMSLPAALQLTPDTLAAYPLPVFPADSARQTAWQQLLAAPEAVKIGLVVSGNPQHQNDHNRSLPLAALAALFDLPAQFFLLQKEVRDRDAALITADPRITCLAEHLNDFTDTAAALREFDLILSVDTAVAHLAGNLGRPLWLLLDAAAEWRFSTDTTAQAWYPQARCWRQTTPGDWNSLVPALSAALADFMTTKQSTIYTQHATGVE